MESYEKFRIPLSKAVAITVRDEYSKRELEKIGLNNVYLSRDLVLTASGTHAPYLFAPREVHKIGIVAAPICTETPDVSELFIERLGQVASLLSSKYQVSIIPFQPDYDANVCIQLAGVSENVQLLSDSTDTWASLRYIEEQDLIIGLRFHSIVEALIKGKYVIPIVYHPKSASLCSEVGLDKYAQYVGNGNNWPLSNLDVKGIVRNVELIQQDENYFPSVSSFLNDVSECNIDEEIIRTILEKPDSSTR